MKAEQFMKECLEKAEKEGKDYGMCLPPTEAQEGLNILIKHFLGKDWCSVMPMSTAQINTLAIHEILENYPEKKTIRERLKPLTRQ